MSKDGFMYEQSLLDHKVEAGCIQFTYSISIKGDWDLPFTRLLTKCLRFDWSDQVSKLLKGCFVEDE